MQSADNTCLRLDVLIVGGGFAGAAAALALNGRGISVAIADTRDWKRPASDGWGETVPPSTKRLLKKLGLDVIEDQCSEETFGVASAWGAPEAVTSSFLTSPFGSGLRIDRYGLMRRMTEALQERRIPTWFRSNVLVAKGRSEKVATISSKDREFDVSYDVIIDASGRHRAIMRLRTRVRRFDRLVACSLSTNEPERTTETDLSFELSFVEAVEDGWWYSTATPRGQRVFVRFADAGTFVVRKIRQLEGFLEDLRRTQHISAIARACDFSDIAGVNYASAASTCLRDVAGPFWAAIGDAARTVDPLSAQGIHNALQDGLKVAEAINACLSTRQPNPLIEFGKTVQTEYQTYLDTKDEFYAAETRWQHHPFWSLRRP